MMDPTFTFTLLAIFLGSAGIALLIVSGVARDEDKKFSIACLLLSLLCFITSWHISYEQKHKELSDFRYQINYQEMQRDISVKKIIKEKGKEPQYVIAIEHENEKTIPESIYQEYIGDESNAITIKVATLYLYEGETFPFGIETSFNGKTSHIRTVGEYRFSCPWEPDVAPYTEEEVKELAYNFMKDNSYGRIHGGCYNDVSSEAISFE